MPETTTLTLPATYSLLSSEALGQQLIPLYDFPEQTKVVFIYQGLHDTYLIKGPATKFILRIYRAGWKTYSQVEAELQLLLLLKKEELPVSYPIADKKGISIHRINSPEGERYAVVFSYADGEKIRSLSTAQATLFGKFMASMHSFTTSRQIPDLQRKYTPESILEGTMQAIQIVLPTHPEVHQKLESIFAILRKLLQPEMLQELKTGICHGDPHDENIFIESATNKITMYDFDFSGNGYLLYDIGSFCFYQRHNEKNIEAFLTGYSRILPLSQTEVSLIPHFKLLMRLFHLGARSRNADGIKNPLWFPEEIVEKINEIGKEALLLK